MGIFKKLSKQIKAKNPSAKGEETKNRKGLIGKILGRMKPPGQPNREGMIKNAISKLKTKTPRAIANKTPTAMKPPVISPLSQGPYGRSLKRSSPKPATRTAGSTESVSNQPSVQGAVKRLAKGPGLKDGGSVKKYKAGGLAIKGLGKAFKNSKR
jgi:hypothetical protein